MSAQAQLWTHPSHRVSISTAVNTHESCQHKHSCEHTRVIVSAQAQLWTHAILHVTAYTAVNTPESPCQHKHIAVNTHEPSCQHKHICEHTWVIISTQAQLWTIDYSLHGWYQHLMNRKRVLDRPACPVAHSEEEVPGSSPAAADIVFFYVDSNTIAEWMKVLITAIYT